MNPAPVCTEAEPQRQTVADLNEMCRSSGKTLTGGGVTDAWLFQPDEQARQRRQRWPGGGDGEESASLLRQYILGLCTGRPSCDCGDYHCTAFGNALAASSATFAVAANTTPRTE